MHPYTYTAFRDELEKIALNAQKIREQGQQMVAQGQMIKRRSFPPSFFGVVDDATECDSAPIVVETAPLL